MQNIKNIVNSIGYYKYNGFKCHDDCSVGVMMVYRL